MPAERFSSSNHFLHVSAGAERRQWILAPARSLEKVSGLILFSTDVSGLTRNADLVFDFVVVRFEFFVGEWPVFDRRTLGNTRRPIAPDRFGANFEIPGIQSPALRPVMHRGAADGVHHRVIDSRRRLRGIGSRGYSFEFCFLRSWRP